MVLPGSQSRYRVEGSGEPCMDYRKRLPGLVTARLSPGVLGEGDRIYANLSAAKQNALLTCLTNNGLQKRTGKWGAATGALISGTTIADLGRDGLLAINSKRNSASLTHRGLLAMSWHHMAAELVASKEAAQIQESPSAGSSSVLHSLCPS